MSHERIGTSSNHWSVFPHCLHALRPPSECPVSCLKMSTFVKLPMMSPVPLQRTASRNIRGLYHHKCAHRVRIWRKCQTNAMESRKRGGPYSRYRDS